MNLPKGWKNVELNEVCIISNGSTPSRIIQEYWNGKILWATPTDVSKLKSKYIDNTKDKITEQGYESCSTSMLPVGSVLFTSRASIGHIAIAKKEICTNQGFKNFVCKKDMIIPEYLYYCLKLKTEEIRQLASGSTFMEISMASIRKVKIPLPPIPVQQKIVARLESVEQLKQSRQQANTETAKLVQSLFYKMFGDPVKNEKGWNKVSVGECCQVKGGKRVPKGMRFSDIKTSRPYLRVTDMRENTIIDDDIKYISEEVFSKIERYTISSDDVYITIAGSIGLVGIIPIKHNGASLTENAAKLVFDKGKMNKLYLTYMLNSDYCKKQIGVHTHAVGVPKLALFRIEKIEVLLPPVELQNQFARMVNNIDFLKEKQQQSTNEIEVLFDALMHKMFSVA